MNTYDVIVVANENNLDIRFREKYKNYLIPKVRGFGYWAWKAQIILQTLSQMDDGDLLQYTDAGCHLNTSGRENLLRYFSRAEQSVTGILGFQAVPPDFHNKKISLPDLREYKWCKGDLLDALGVRCQMSIINTQTIGATVLFIKKCDASLSIIQQWLQTYDSNISLIDDSVSKSENIIGFVEHRHDQAIFSLLGKMHNIETVSAYEYWYPSATIPFLPDWRILQKYPVHVKRDKGIHWSMRPYALLLRIYKRFRFELKKRS